MVLGVWLVLSACSPTEPGDVSVSAPGEDSRSSRGALFAGTNRWVRPNLWGDPLADVDVLVVGGGAAGLTAAIEAEEAGASVLVVERADQTGGSLRYGATVMLFSGTSIEASLGIEDSPEELLAEWPDFTGGDPDDPWVQTFAEDNVSEVFEWLEARDVRFGMSLGIDESGGAVRRLHPIADGSDTMADTLTTRVGSANIWLNTEAQGLWFYPGVAMRGVAVEDLSTGETGWVRARSVVMATGGFLRNLSLVAAADPTLDASALWFSCGPEADGSGHELLAALGARWDNPSAIGLYAHGLPDTRTSGEELLLNPMASMVMVNEAGERFLNESQQNSFHNGRAVVEQDDQVAWAVFDATVKDDLVIVDPMELPGESGVLPSDAELEAAGYLASADTVADLATTIGVDGDALSAELETYNAEIASGSLDPWWGTPLTGTALETAPYYAIRVAPVVAKAFGGIDVDLTGRVLLEDGTTQPGLYAAGELTGMAGGSLVGDYGFTGSLSAVVLGARIAGGSAADYAISRR